jgi:hypothetical protein
MAAPHSILTLKARRDALHAQIVQAPTMALMEEYFAIIEDLGDLDVPHDVLVRLAALSAIKPPPVSVGPDGRVHLDYMEMDISYACNLRCENCSHYSNFVMSGVVSLADAERWMTDWSKRVLPRNLRLMGGEAAINPEAAAIVRAAARLFPDSHRAVVSNGLVLHKRPDLLDALVETGTWLNVSIHELDAEALQRYADLQSNCEAKGVQLILSKFQPDQFAALYQTTPDGPEPFEFGQPVASWAACFGKTCIFLNDNKLWKCASLGMLHHLQSRSKTKLSDKWAPYLAHQGITADVSTEKLVAYLSYPESACALCPVEAFNPAADFAQRVTIKRG